MSLFGVSVQMKDTKLKVVNGDKNQRLSSLQLLRSVSQQLSLVKSLTESGRPVPRTYQLFHERAKEFGFDDELIIKKTWKRVKQKENQETKRKNAIYKDLGHKNADPELIYISDIDSDDEGNTSYEVPTQTKQSKLSSYKERPNICHMNKVDVSNTSYTFRVDCSKFEINQISDSMCVLRSDIMNPIRSQRKTITENSSFDVHPSQFKSSGLNKSKHIHKASKSSEASSLKKFKSISKTDFVNFIKMQKKLKKREKKLLEDQLKSKIANRIVDVIIPKYHNK